MVQTNFSAKPAGEGAGIYDGTVTLSTRQRQKPTNLPTYLPSGTGTVQVQELLALVTGTVQAAVPGTPSAANDAVEPVPG